MSYTYSYFVPLSPEPEPVEYARRAKEYLMAQKVISKGDEPGYFNMGADAVLPFEQRDDWDAGFEFCVIFGGPHLTIVPGDDEPIEAQCPRCQTGVGPELSQLYRPEEAKSVGSIDFTGATVRCPKCGGVFRPDELIDPRGQPIFLTRRHVCFVNAGKFRAEWLAEFDKAAGTPHRFVIYRYTGGVWWSRL